MSDSTFVHEIENPLAAQTGWLDHESLIVGVYGKYTFNSTETHGLITIIQSADGFGFNPLDDLGEIDAEQAIVTTAAGARLLAAELLKAADFADQKAPE